MIHCKTHTHTSNIFSFRYFSSHNAHSCTHFVQSTATNDTYILLFRCIYILLSDLHYSFHHLGQRARFALCFIYFRHEQNLTIQRTEHAWLRAKWPITINWLSGEWTFHELLDAIDSLQVENLNERQKEDIGSQH